MPTICVRVPGQTFDQAAKDLLASGITDACARAESIPDDLARRIGIWVLIDEVAEGYWFAAGARDALAAFVPVVVQVYPPAGVLDADRREILVRGISSAVDAALSDEKRKAQTSVVILEVPEGHWGVREQIIGLKQHAALWGYEHLQHLVTGDAVTMDTAPPSAE